MLLGTLVIALAAAMAAVPARAGAVASTPLDDGDRQLVADRRGR